MWPLALVLAVSACTGERAPRPSPDASPQTSPPPVTSATEYVYTGPGIEARLELVGGGAELTIENTTGSELPEPGIYVLDARDGGRVDWTLALPAQVADGALERFTLLRPDAPDAKHIGLVALTFGGEDYGAFVPPQPVPEDGA